MTTTLKVGIRKAGLCSISKEASPKSSYATSFNSTHATICITQATVPDKRIERHTDAVYTYKV